MTIMVGKVDITAAPEAASPKVRVLSLGAGVQSTTLALMAARGEIEQPDCAIFADTGWEPREVYEHLDRLEKALPFPVIRVSAGRNIRDDIVKKNTTNQGRAPSVPWFTLDAKGNRGIAPRQCTQEYKISPIYRKIRELLGGSGKTRVKGFAEVWIGISTDEAVRMKPSKVHYIRNVWPLIERRMSRSDCAAYLQRAGWKAPKSACIGCPFRSDEAWLYLRKNSPDEWQDAVAIDRIIREGGRKRGIKARQFMHKSCLPLEEADIKDWESRGQPDLFGNECEGMCGV